MKLLQPKSIMLPLAIVSVMAPGVSFLVSILGVEFRWLVLAALCVYLLMSWSGLRTAPTAVVVTVAFYLVWCVSTAIWAAVPTLTLMKCVALIMVTFAALFGGYHWSVHRDAKSGLDYLWPYVLIALVTGLLGGGAEPADATDVLDLYAGAAGGPNALGSMVATSTPFALWHLYRSRGNRKLRLMWLAVLIALVVTLYLSVARSSYLLFIAVLFGMTAGFGVSRRLALVLLGIAVAVGALYVAAPEMIEDFVQRNVYKQTREQDEEIFYSRISPWEESYDGAVAGGMIGLGYGLSVGEYEFQGGLTAVGYGREKGNTQLAIVEETGLIGLTLYFVLHVVLFAKLVDGFRAAPRGDLRILLGLIIGTLSGLVLQSLVEAWWVAPGSVQYAFFWALAGSGLAISESVRRRSVGERFRQPAYV